MRRVIPAKHRIAFGDVPNKKEIVGRMDMAKWDIVEVKVLTGTDDLERAALVMEGWGCPETLITKAEGFGPV